MQLDDNSYDELTRNWYRSERVACSYGQAQKAFGGSPPEAAVAILERRTIAGLLKRLPQPACSVLDVPAGTGKLRPMLERRSTTYVGVDIAFEMLSFGGAASRAVQADGVALPFRDSQFDVVVCLRLLHRVPLAIRASLVAEFCRVARTAVIASYAAPPRSGQLYELMGAAFRRKRGWGGGQPLQEPGTFRNMIQEVGAEVLCDNSISGRMTAERVALIGLGEARG